jgi:hypothetical protein
MNWSNGRGLQEEPDPRTVKMKTHLRPLAFGEHWFTGVVRDAQVIRHALAVRVPPASPSFGPTR